MPLQYIRHPTCGNVSASAGDPLMGYKTANDFMDYGPPMTTAEWKAMVILANDARDDTRITWSPVTSDKIMQRIKLAPKAWTNLRGDLVRKGFLEVVESGRKGCCAKYRIPEYPKIGHPLGDESVSEDEMRHPGGDASCPDDHDAALPDDSMSHPAGDESEQIRHPGGAGSAECVTQEVPPTYYPSLLEQITYETSLSPGAAASPAAVPTNEREINGMEPEPQPEEPQARPQEQRPAKEAQQPSKFDARAVAGSWAQGRSDAGQPATNAERDCIQAQAAELLAVGDSLEHLLRLARWMGRERPGWKDLVHARGYNEAPKAAIPAQRGWESDKPCAPGACDNHDHPPCDHGWIALEDGDAHCPCWSSPSRPKPKPGEHQTYRDPDPSVYYDPKAKRDHVGWQNPTDPDAYEGTF